MQDSTAHLRVINKINRIVLYSQTEKFSLIFFFHFLVGINHFKYERTSSSAFLRNFIRPSDTKGIQARESFHGGDDETSRHKYQRISHFKHQ